MTKLREIKTQHLGDLLSRANELRRKFRETLEAGGASDDLSQAHVSVEQEWEILGLVHTFAQASLVNVTRLVKGAIPRIDEHDYWYAAPIMPTWSYKAAFDIINHTRNCVIRALQDRQQSPRHGAEAGAILSSLERV